MEESEGLRNVIGDEERRSNTSRRLRRKTVR